MDNRQQALYDAANRIIDRSLRCLRYGIAPNLNEADTLTLVRYKGAIQQFSCDLPISCRKLLSAIDELKG